MYEIRYDAAAKILHLKFTGFWTLETVHRLAADVMAAGQRIEGTPKVFDVLTDSTDFPVQANAVSEALASVMNAGYALRTGRTAIAVSSMLNKIQAERTLGHPTVRVFLSLDEARAWLAAPAAAAA